MTALALINHLLNFLAPACWLALWLPLLGRWLSGRRKTALWTQSLGVFVVGALTLGAGLAWLGSDGKMLTYAALVLLTGSCQWWLLRR